MSKTKAVKADAGKSSKKVRVKEGRVTKPTQTPKAKSKEIAKTAAASHGVQEALKKKNKKVPTPEPESDSSDSSASDSEEGENSDSSASSSEDEEVDIKTPPKSKGAKNPTPQPAAESEDDSDSSNASSDSNDDSEEEAASAKANGTSLPKAATKEQASSDSDEGTSDESDSSEGDSEEEKPTTKAKVNGATEVKNVAEDESDDDSADDSDEADSDEADSEDSSDSESEEEEAPSKKRKAEPEAAPAVKKTKTAETDNGVKNLFVGNLSWNIDEEWLTREFDQFGEIVGCRIIADRDSGRSKGFGYVEYSTADAAKAAQEAMHQADLDGRPLNVDFSTPRQKNNEKPADRAKRYGDQKSAPSDTLFLGNLSFDVTNDTVYEYFSEYGTITRVSLPTDRETGALKGFGYVGYSSVEEAKAASEALHGADIAGRPIRIDFAAPREDNGQRGGFGGRGRGGDRGGRGSRGGRGGRGGFGDRGGRGGGRGGRGGFSTNRGGFGDFKGSKVTF